MQTVHYFGFELVKVTIHDHMLAKLEPEDQRAVARIMNAQREMMGIQQKTQLSWSCQQCGSLFGQLAPPSDQYHCVRNCSFSLCSECLPKVREARNKAAKGTKPRSPQKGPEVASAPVEQHLPSEEKLFGLWEESGGTTRP